MRRRRFLAAAGATVAVACVPAQVVSSTPSASATATSLPVVPTLSPTPSARPAPDWAALRASLRGALFRPGDAGYDTARLLYNTRFDDVRPEAIARCADEKDVQACVLYARRTGVKVAIRGGGHSYAGWSTGTGLVIDLSQLRSVTVGNGVVTAGGGAQLIDVYDAVARAGQAIPGGSCPTVGLVGLTLGGGIGVLSRQWGLTCDQLIAAQVVTASGVLLTCSEQANPDLFWALRGGGGGFGVVTSVTLRTHPAQDLALAFLTWPAASSAAALAAWNTWMPNAPDSIWSTLHLNVGASGPTVDVHAVSTGSLGELAAALDALVARAKAAPDYREQGARPYRDVMLVEAGCNGRSAAQCHLRDVGDGGELERETYAAKSIVAERARLIGDDDPLTPDALAALIEVMRDAPGGAILIDALGGAVARVPIDGTPFPHRNAFAVLQLIASWSTDGAAQMDWLRRAHARLRSQIGPGAYVNYIDPELATWRDAYWGPNYARLSAIRRTYDPDGLFDSPQAAGG